MVERKIHLFLSIILSIIVSVMYKVLMYKDTSLIS